MLRVSVTDIDAYRYWRDADEDSTLDQLRDRLLHRTPPTPQQRIGTMLHHALHHARPGADMLLRIDGVGDDVGLSLSIDCNADVELLPLREHKIARTVQVPGVGPVQLVGKIDSSDAFTIVDYKTTSRFDPEFLIDGMQWRLYLWLLDATRFIWEVFEVKDPLRDEPGVYRLTAHHHVEQWRYPGITADCQRALQEFFAVVQASVPEYVTAKTVPDSNS